MGHKSKVNTVVPYKNYIATGSDDHTIRV